MRTPAQHTAPREVPVNPVDAVAVVGGCPPERSHFARELARSTGRMLLPAQRLKAAPDPVVEAMALVPWCSREQGALVEFPDHADVTELIGACAHPGSPAVLTGVVCVVDAALTDGTPGGSSGSWSTAWRAASSAPCCARRVSAVWPRARTSPRGGTTWVG